MTRRTSAERCADPSDPMHGTRSGYTSHGCRCRHCRAANLWAGREHRNPDSVSEAIDEIADVLLEIRS